MIRRRGDFRPQSAKQQDARGASSHGGDLQSFGSAKDDHVPIRHRTSAHNHPALPIGSLSTQHEDG